MGNDRTSIIDICVLIPCYNNPDGLLTSLKSIVYDPRRYIVVVVDDGSDHAVTSTFLYQHLPLSINIEILRLGHNQGITRALNEGLAFINVHFAPRYIARLDCGDTCDPERFYKQVTFLESNKDIDLLGTWCYFQDMTTRSTYKYITPTRHEVIARSMYFRNVFVHPTVMWRAETLKTCRYPEKYPHAEDYGLFYDIISKKKPQYSINFS